VTLAQHHWSSIIRLFALWFGVDAFQLQLLPHLLQQFIHIPSMFGTDWAGVWNPVKQIQFLNGNGIDLVERVNDWDVAPTFGFKHINHVIDAGIASDSDISRGDAILIHNCFDLVMVDVGQRDSACDVEAPFVLLLEDDIGRLLVDANAEPFQFLLDDSFIREWLVDVKDDEDEVACFGDGDDLSSSSFAILCTSEWQLRCTSLGREQWSVW
jgi:hypothetical protein